MSQHPEVVNETAKPLEIGTGSGGTRNISEHHHFIQVWKKLAEQGHENVFIVCFSVYCKSINIMDFRQKIKI